MTERRRVDEIRPEHYRTARSLECYQGDVGEVMARFRAIPESQSCVKLLMADGTERLFFESETSSVEEVKADA